MTALLTGESSADAEQYSRSHEGTDVGGEPSSKGSGDHEQRANVLTVSASVVQRPSSD